MTTVARRTFAVWVQARPVPQGSKIPRVSKTGKPYMTEQSGERLVTYRGAVVEEASRAIHDLRCGRAAPWVPLTGPLMLTAVFTFARPKSHYGTGRNSAVLKPDAPAHPVTRSVGDLSKLIRATEDALTDAGVWEDDCLVTEMHTAKVYPGGHPLAQPGPGAYIAVTNRVEWFR